MLNVKEKNTIELIDVNHDEIESKFEVLKDEIIAQVCKLRN